MESKNRKPLEFDILVTGKNAYWGLGDTIEEAKTRCKRGGGKAPFIVSIMPKGSEIDGLTISYPADASFILTRIGLI